MSIRKKSFAAAMCLAVCLAAFPVPQAAAVDVSAESGYSEIMPMMEYIFDADYDFTINNGVAGMYALVRGNSEKATKCQVTVELQEKGLLLWSTVDTWTATENGRRAELDISRTVTAGKTYRMVTTVTVWSGSDSETKTMTSSSIKA